MLIEPGYRGFRIEVNAAADGERWNADVSISDTLSSDTPHHELVSCYKPTPEHAEWAGMLWARRWIDRQAFRQERAVLDQRKISLVSEFLEESFVGCSVYDSEDNDRAAQLYQIFNETTGEIQHRVYISRAFLDGHAESEIIPALQTLGLVMCLGMARSRHVTVKGQMIEMIDIEQGS